MEQTFKKGDRVVGLGVKGVYERPYGDIDDNEHLIRRDDGKAAAHEPFWWFDGTDLQHDRDFQVGDWVRYVRIDKWATQEDGKIGVIEEIKGPASVWVQWEGEETRRDHANEYLVKIAPPTEEKMSETVIIEHDQWGRVEGVGRNMEPCRPLNVMWEKDGACYTEFHGWREVKPKRWVPVPVERCSEREIGVHIVDEDGLGHSSYLSLPPDHRFKTVEIEREAEG